MTRTTKTILMATIAALALCAAVYAASAQAPISSENSGEQETSFGDLLADALRAAADADIAFVPAVSCKPGIIPAGPVATDDLEGLLQNPSEVWAVSKLSGRQIQDAMEKSLSRLPGTNSGFLQVAGMKVKFDADAQRNNRVTSITVDENALKPDAEYTVAMPLSLAKGGSGYFTVFDATSIVDSPSEQSLIDALDEFVSQKETLDYSGQGRLIAH